MLFCDVVPEKAMDVFKRVKTRSKFRVNSILHPKKPTFVDAWNCLNASSIEAHNTVWNLKHTVMCFVYCSKALNEYDSLVNPYGAFYVVNRLCHGHHLALGVRGLSFIIPYTNQLKFGGAHGLTSKVQPRFNLLAKLIVRS